MPRVLARLTERNEWKFFSVLPKADPGLAAAWWALLILRGVLPAVFAVALGALVAAVPDPGHATQLTREEITASVHYVGFALSDEQVEAFATGPVELALEHPNYQESTVLPAGTVEALLADLRG